MRYLILLLLFLQACDQQPPKAFYYTGCASPGIHKHDVIRNCGNPNDYNFESVEKGMYEKLFYYYPKCKEVYLLQDVVVAVYSCS